MAGYLCRRALPTLVALGAAIALFLALAHGEIPVSAARGESRQVPVLMYHSLLMNPAAAGPYVLSPALLEADMAWLRDRGYQPVLVRDLAAFVRGEGTLPPKPVALTFDDGHLNNLTYLPQLLEAYDFCATVFVVGEFSETATRVDDPNPAYAYLTWADITALARGGRVDIGNHSYYAHSRIPSDAKRRAVYGPTLVADAADMQRALAEKSDMAATVYAYPYGFVLPGSGMELQALGFEATLSCTERFNTVAAGDESCLFPLGRFNRPAGESTEAFMARIGLK